MRWTDKTLKLIIGGLLVQLSHRPDCDHSIQGLAVFDFASVRFDADQVSEVLKIEEQEVIPKIQKRQPLEGQNAVGFRQESLWKQI